MTPIENIKQKGRELADLSEREKISSIVIVLEPAPNGLTMKTFLPGSFNKADILGALHLAFEDVQAM